MTHTSVAARRWHSLSVIVLFALTAICAAYMVAIDGRDSELFKLGCIISSAIAGAEVTRLTSRTRIRDLTLGSACCTGVVFGIAMYVSIPMHPFTRDATFESVVYLTALAGLFFGICGGVVGFIYAGCSWIVSQARPSE